MRRPCEERLIALLQVQCRSTATPTTPTASEPETRTSSPEPLISTNSLAASGDTEVGTEAIEVIPVPILSLCFLPHPPDPLPQTQSCTSHVSLGVCFRTKVTTTSAFCSTWTWFSDSSLQYWIELNSALDQMDPSLLELQSNKQRTFWKL